MRKYRALALAVLALFTAAFLYACDQKTGAGEPVKPSTTQPPGTIHWTCKACKTSVDMMAGKTPDCPKCKKPMEKGETITYKCEKCNKTEEVDKADAAPACPKCKGKMTKS